MEMKIEDKWKAFAVGHFFSGEADDPVAIYDALTACFTLDQAVQVFDKFELLPWEPFEDNPMLDFPALLATMAEDLQLTAGEGDTDRLRDCLRRAILVIEDFMPNIGRCVLQDYERLNNVLCDSQALLTQGGVMLKNATVREE